MRHFHRLVAAWILLVASPTAWCAAPAESIALPSGLKPEDVEKTPYREYVRQCMDRLIGSGTDRYGAVRSPMLVSIIDVRSGECPEDPLLLDEAYRAIRRGRRAPAGSNLHFDQATIRAMLALSHISGDRRYAEAANAYLRYFMDHLVDDKGLFWWGWHRHYDVFKDKMTGHLGDVHEIHIQEPIWPELWAVNPKAVTREIEAIWQWHVIDKKTGEVNRHADGRRGCDFAMTAGEILESFAFLYSKTKEPVWLERAKLVADYHWRARDPKTGLIPNRPNAGANRFDGGHFDTSIAGLYGRGLLRAGELTAQAIFTRQAVHHLKAYAKYGYDSSTKSFWGSLNLDGTPVPGPRKPGGYAQYEPLGAIDPWQPYAAGYEMPLPAAQCYALAYHVTREAVLLETAQRWADYLRRAWPPRNANRDGWYAAYSKQWAPLGTYAENYGRTISLLLALDRLTGDRQYRQFARDVAQEAVSKLHYRGWLRGHPGKPYYEAHDGVGFLLVALVQLDRVMESEKTERKEPRMNTNEHGWDVQNL